VFLKAKLFKKKGCHLKAPKLFDGKQQNREINKVFSKFN